MFSITREGFDQPKEMLQDLFNSGDFADVTLVCDDLKQIQTHKFILSFQSPVMRSFLSINNTNPLIYLRGVNREEMEAVLEFLYLGQTQISSGRVEKFLKLAQDLNIKHISQACHQPDKEGEKTGEIIEKNVLEEREEEAEDVLMKTNENLDTNNLPPENETENPVKLENVDLFPCNHCKRKFTLENSLRRHIESAHKNLEHSCSYCDSSFRDKTSLNRHIETSHGGERLTCNYCNENYSSQAGLTFHIKRGHSTI